MELSLLILVCIHKSYIVYLEINVVPTGHGFSFFWLWKSHGKSILKKRGHPVCTSHGLVVEAMDTSLSICLSDWQRQEGHLAKVL